MCRKKVQEHEGDRAMELKDFVRDSLTEILEGALATHEAIKGKGAAVNPETGALRPDTAGSTKAHGMVNCVEFDVALTDAEKTSASGGIGVFLGSLNLGGKAEKGTEASSLTRIKFRIPLGLPHGG